MTHLLTHAATRLLGPRCPYRGCRRRSRHMDRHYDRAHGGEA